MRYRRFLVAAYEYLKEHDPTILTNPEKREFVATQMFHGYDFDETMLRIASMNMMMHGIESPDIEFRNSLSETASEDQDWSSLVLANPPFAGALNEQEVAKNLLAVAKTKKTELLFLALFIRLLRPGGRAAVIVPDGVLFGSTKAHKDIRKALIEDQKLDAVIKLPSGVFRPYAGVSTAILFFTKTDSGGTENVWFYDVTADGYSLDDKRNPIAANDLPDVLNRWRTLSAASHDSVVEPVETTSPNPVVEPVETATTPSEHNRKRTDKSFLVPKKEIVDQGYDLSINRYKEIIHDEIEYRPPLEIIAEIERLDAEIATSLATLKTLLATPLDQHNSVVEPVAMY